MKSTRAVLTAFALATSLGCSLMYDWQGLVPCATGENCEEGYTCQLGTCGLDTDEPFCGDRVVEGDEQCDDGNTNGEDVCTVDCTFYRHPGACVIDYDIGIDNTIEGREFYEYDDRGYLTKYSWDNDNNGDVDSSTAYGYDRWGRIIREEYHWEGDPDPEMVLSYTFNLTDRYERVVRVDVEYPDDEHLGTFEWPNERESVLTWDYWDDGSDDTKLYTFYDDRGLIVKREWDEADYTIDGVIDKRCHWTYNEQGWLIRVEFDDNGDTDGSQAPDNIHHYHHDNKGNVTHVDSDFDGDEEIDAVFTFDYSCWSG